MALDETSTIAIPYRIVMPDHLCPFGPKSKDLLERQGYAVDDHQLTTRNETEGFMKEHGVATTPQTLIGGDRIGGYEDLRARFAKEVKDADDLPSYWSAWDTLS